MWPCVEIKERKEGGVYINDLNPRNGMVGLDGSTPHLVSFISHHHPYGERRGVLVALREPPRDGVERFAIGHVVDFFFEYFSQTCLFCCRIPNVKKKFLRTEEDALCAAIVRRREGTETRVAGGILYDIIVAR